MKKLILNTLFILISLSNVNFASAQEIQVSVTLGNSPLSPQVIPNGTTYDVSTLFGNNINLALYLPVTVTVRNISSSTSVDLVALTPVVSGTGASDFILNTANYNGELPALQSTTFTLGLSPSASNGVKTVNIAIPTNSPANSTPNGTAFEYTGSLTYNLANLTSTSIVKASDIGLSIYPNPSADGDFKVAANNVVVDRIVVSNVYGVSQTFTATEFRTDLTGLLLVQMYTSKGIVSEKIIVD